MLLKYDKGLGLQGLGFGVQHRVWNPVGEMPRTRRRLTKYWVFVKEPNLSYHYRDLSQTPVPSSLNPYINA